MFETLREKLESAFLKLRSKGKLSASDVDLALREIRKSLLEADVDFKVVKELVGKIRARATELQVLESITAVQHISTVVYEELLSLMGEPSSLEIASKPPTVILMVGLQGSGKTTTAVKLARRLQNGHSPLVVACDLRRPAAVEQLRVLAEQSKVAFYGPEASHAEAVLNVVKGAISYAESHLNDVILLDTAGRLHVDQELMEELAAIAQIAPPHETLLVVDAMTGQEAVNVAKSFHGALPLTGLILTKMDGDARGGSALAIRAITGIPVKFAGIGEATDALEVFDPRRVVGRIMGMGDIQGLLEKVQAIGAGNAEKIASTLKSKDFNLEMLLMQFEQMEKMGPVGKMLEMIPGFNRVKALSNAEIDNSVMKRNKAIIQSMTKAERRNPKIIKGSRRRRIALGSGTSVQMVNRLLTQYEQMKKLYKTFSSDGKGFNLKSMFGGAGRFK